MKFTGIVLGVDAVEADSVLHPRGRRRRETDKRIRPSTSRARREPIETSRHTKSKGHEGSLLHRGSDSIFQKHQRKPVPGVTS